MKRLSGLVGVLLVVGWASSLSSPPTEFRHDRLLRTSSFGERSFRKEPPPSPLQRQVKRRALLSQKARFNKQQPGKDLLAKDDPPNDDHQHGTFLATLMVGKLGIAPQATLLPVKVLDRHLVGTELALAQGIHYAAKQGAQIINMSLAFPRGYYPSRILQEAVSYALKTHPGGQQEFPLFQGGKDAPPRNVHDRSSQKEQIQFLRPGGEEGSLLLSRHKGASMKGTHYKVAPSKAPVHRHSALCAVLYILAQRNKL